MSFEKWILEQVKQKKEAEDAVGAERKKEATKRMLISVKLSAVKKSATAGKRWKVKKEKDGQDTKLIRVKKVLKPKDMVRKACPMCVLTDELAYSWISLNDSLDQACSQPQPQAQQSEY